MSDDSPKKIPNRAMTDEEKRAVIEQIYEAWTSKALREQRLGQLLDNAAWNIDVPVRQIEDETLAIAVSGFARKYE